MKVSAPDIRKINMRKFACACLFYYIYIKLPISVPPNYLQIIIDLPQCWVSLIYDGFTYHMNGTEGLIFFAEERIKVWKEEDGTINLNKVHDKFQAKKDKKSKSHIL